MTIAAEAAALGAPLFDPPIHLELLDDGHREALRAACAADREIWEIYPICLAGAQFDPAFEAMLADPARTSFACFAGGVLIGTSAYLHIDAPSGALEIGGTYLAPQARGTGINGRIKRLMIDRAIACGFQRIEFRVDARNLRSIAAVEKLGAVREGVLRRQRRTWTGHLRDTIVYALLAEEWRG